MSKRHSGEMAIRRALYRRKTGLTRHELADRTGLLLQTVCPRVRDMFLRGEVEVCGFDVVGGIRRSRVRLA